MTRIQVNKIKKNEDYLGWCVYVSRCEHLKTQGVVRLFIYWNIHSAGHICFDLFWLSYFLMLTSHLSFFFSSSLPPIRYAHQHHTSITVVATTTPNPIWFAADWTSETNNVNLNVSTQCIEYFSNKTKKLNNSLIILIG